MKWKAIVVAASFCISSWAYDCDNLIVDNGQKICRTTFPNGNFLDYTIGHRPTKTFREAQEQCERLTAQNKTWRLPTPMEGMMLFYNHAQGLDLTFILDYKLTAPDAPGFIFWAASMKDEDGEDDYPKPSDDKLVGTDPLYKAAAPATVDDPVFLITRKFLDNTWLSLAALKWKFGLPDPLAVQTFCVPTDRSVCGFRAHL